MMRAPHSGHAAQKVDCRTGMLGGDRLTPAALRDMEASEGDRCGRRSEAGAVLQSRSSVTVDDSGVGHIVDNAKLRAQHCRQCVFQRGCIRQA